MYVFANILAYHSPDHFKTAWLVYSGPDGVKMVRWFKLCPQSICICMDVSKGYNVVCTYVSSGVADYGSINVTLTFDESSTRACSDISIVDDSIYEGTESFGVRIVSTDVEVILEPHTGSVTITDNDSRSQ